MAVVTENSIPAIQSPTSAPIVVDLGKKPRKQVKQLRRGKGKLVDEVGAVLEELRANGTLAPDVQPVVLIVREKRRRANPLWPLGT